MVRSSYGGGRFGRYSGAGGQDAAVLAVPMKLDDIAVTMAIAAGGAWVGTLARELSQERRKISWKMMMLETPGALVCGFGAGGLADAMGFHSPLVVAGAGGAPGIDRFEPSQSGVQLIQGLVTTYFDDVMRKLLYIYYVIKVQ